MIPPAPPVSFWKVYIGRPRVRLRAGAEQRLDHRGMILGGREHQGRLAAEFLGGIRIGARLEEQSDGLHAARSCGQHERCFALAIHRVCRCACTKQRVDDCRAADRGRFVQRRHAIAVRHARPCASGEESLDRVEVVPVRRPLQGSRSINVRRIHIGALFDQRARSRGVLVLECRDETQIRLSTGR